MPDQINDKKRFMHVRLKIGISALLILATLVTFGQVIEFEFLNYDDDEYITANKNIQKGFSLENIAWALTAEVSGNWHPFTLFSHMLDYRLFGLDAGKHHLTNLILHMINSLLLFLVFSRISKKIYPSAFIAALFALHPLHVESVAWVSERKDVLSTFFFMLTLWCYYKYIEHPSTKCYLAIVFFFIFGLASKPMLVTVPFVLILLDVWPLKRMSFSNSTGNYELIIEKIPLFMLSLVSCVITILFQHKGEAVGTVARFPISIRIGNALVAYIEYLKKTFWPFDLAIFYPHTGLPPTAIIIGSLIFLILFSAIAVISLKQFPWLFTGWFWYIGTMFPVIGIVQVGSQAMADRYTYIPLIGIFLILCYGITEFLSKTRTKIVAGVLAVSFITLLMLATWIQTRYFRDSKILFQHALYVTSENAIAHNNLGETLVKNGQMRKALYHFSESIRISPDFDSAHNNMGNILVELGKTEAAEKHYRKAIQLNPNYADALNNLGTLLYSKNHVQEAISCFKSSINLNPDSYVARRNLEIILNRMKHTKQKENK